jgi:hypothetical protein
MSERQSVPEIERIFTSNRHVETFFDVLVPPGVGSADAHIYLQAHLGSDMADKYERNDGSGETKPSESR